MFALCRVYRKIYTKFGTNHNRLSPALNMQARCSDGQSLGKMIIEGQVDHVHLPGGPEPPYDTSSQLDLLNTTEQRGFSESTSYA